VRIAVEGELLWVTFGMAQPALRGELEAYGDNEFVERDEFGHFEGTVVSFQHAPDGGLLLLFDGQPIGERVASTR
jgi:redox-sensitive bicupin YhaK (pirin superfamily)